jgi:hypothetical protein
MTGVKHTTGKLSKTIGEGRGTPLKVFRVHANSVVAVHMGWPIRHDAVKQALPGIPHIRQRPAEDADHFAWLGKKERR